MIPMAKRSHRVFAALLIALFIFSSAAFTVNAATASTRVSAKRGSEIMLYPGGMPFGVKFITEGVLVVGFCDVKNQNSVSNPSLEAGLKQGDIILKIDGQTVSAATELLDIIEKSNGRALSLVCSRDGKEYTTRLTPAFSGEEGCYKSGIYVRDSGAGIGTVTFIVPESNEFAGLGHGICDSNTGELIPMQRGSVVNVTINGVVKGLPGTPGEVKGYFSSGKTGSLLGNTECGVYGVLVSRPSSVPSSPMPIGRRNDLKEGKAHIWCTLDEGAPQRYEIEIRDIKRDSTSNKCFTIKVTDEELISKTGGIIQGMSGSPIIQNGKLVGAVTHVLINDASTGYGIFIENMLNAANIPMAKAS
jgi:stage IV sporulation protein B